MMIGRISRTFAAVAALNGLIVAGAAAGQTNAPDAPVSAITVETIASGLANPWGLQFLPDGRMLVTEKSGTLKIIDRAGKISAPISGVPEVWNKGQGGLLDVLLAPDFSTSSVIYFSYSEPRGASRNGTSVAKAKLSITEQGGTLEGVSVIFRQEPAIASSVHFGSRLVFDKTGALFITLGDRGTQKTQSQNPTNTIGKVVRIMPDGSVPPDNPKIDGWDPKIWSIGHRNAQGAVLDPKSGELWITEHGAQGGDELNKPEKGKNYGWPIITWGIDYSGAKIGEGTAKDGMEQPVYYWKPSIATSGLAYYTGDLFPGWKGNVLAGGLKGAVLERLVLENGKIVAAEKVLANLDERVRDVRQGPDGAIWVLTDDDRDGKLLRLSPKS